MLKPQKMRTRHRDLNWLKFNERVLQEAKDPTNPLYEKIKFLAIFSINLDEYFQVRVSQLRQLKRIDKSIRKQLALKPSKQVKEILAEVKEQQQEFGRIFYEIIVPELAENDIFLLGEKDLKKRKSSTTVDFFKKAVQYISPIVIKNDQKEKLFLENNVLYFLITFQNDDALGIVNLPVEQCGRFVEYESSPHIHEIAFVDDIIKSQIPALFPDYEVEAAYEIKISRDAELYIDDELEGFLAEKIYESLQQRDEGQPTRLLYDSQMPKDIQKRLRKLLGLGKIDMMPGGVYHNFGDFMEFPDPTDESDLHAEPLEPVLHKSLEHASDYFAEISKKDQSVHFPYISFGYVERFLHQAASDEYVTEIKISIYRVADESALTNSLLRALENRKKVTVFIEAKARFDEKNNIDWGRKFEDAGAKVIYSYPRIKVHSKILLVRRQEPEGMQKYSYIGTGNFNSKTSKIYCDHAIFTAREKITKELERLFKVLERELIIPRAKRLLISPFSTRKKFSDMIKRETNNAREGKKAAVTAKMNSLEDPEMIELLYEASNAGVKVRLLVRGFCCLVPGVEGMSENIYVTSIVDRFLEHGRIYLFYNDGDEELFFGSADIMIRNLDRRIEVITPIYDPDIFKEFKDILEIQLQDNVKARIQDAFESNEYVQRKPKVPAVRSQMEIYKYLKKKHSDGQN